VAAEGHLGLRSRKPIDAWSFGRFLQPEREPFKMRGGRESCSVPIQKQQGGRERRQRGGLPPTWRPGDLAQLAEARRAWWEQGYISFEKEGGLRPRRKLLWPRGVGVGGLIRKKAGCLGVGNLRDGKVLRVFKLAAFYDRVDPD